MSRFFLIYFPIIGVKNCIGPTPFMSFEENIFFSATFAGSL